MDNKFDSKVNPQIYKGHAISRNGSLMLLYISARCNTKITPGMKRKSVFSLTVTLKEVTKYFNLM